MEQVILVDGDNNEIGFEEKIKAHKDGKLHRAFSIFIFNSKNELLIQQRAKDKYHSEELWSNSVCSHPKPNESYEQAVHRRLQEEMGFDCKLKKLYCFIYKNSFQNGLIENEYDCVFVGNFDGELKPNPNEIMNVKWIGLEELKKDVDENPDKYSVWLKIVLGSEEFKSLDLNSL